MKGMIIMNLRNRLKQGDYVMLMPMGIHITVQYNISGNMEKIYVGFDSNRIDHTDKLLPILLKHRIIPTNIQLRTGTSWVEGVLYSGNIPRKSGAIPAVSESDMLEKFISAPTNYNFFASAIKSTSTEFLSINSIRQFLTLNKFKILPGWNITIKVMDNMLESWLSSGQYTFTDIITDLIIYRDNKPTVNPLHMSMQTVRSTSEYIDINGYVKLKLTFKDSDLIKYLDYSDAVRLNIQVGSTLVLSPDNEIWRCLPSPKNVVRSNVLTCPFCGKLYDVPPSGLVSCPDDHCSSKLVTAIQQFCGVMNLPTYDVSIISNWLRTHIITCIPDLFLLDEYKDSLCKIPISKLLRALIPMNFIHSEAVLLEFALACSNKERTIRYYINNPDKIASDLIIVSPDITKLIAWLSDDCNASDLTTLLNSTQIELTESHKRFEGAPIFRDKTIYVTGTFIHGGIGEISEILQSYSAKVTTSFSNVVNCVLVGGMQEGVDGKAIRSARNLQIPVIDELTFFKQYDIDTDLQRCPSV